MDIQLLLKSWAQNLYTVSSSHTLWAQASRLRAEESHPTYHRGWGGRSGSLLESQIFQSSLHC